MARGVIANDFVNRFHFQRFQSFKFPELDSTGARPLGAGVMLKVKFNERPPKRAAKPGGRIGIDPTLLTVDPFHRAHGYQ